MFKYNNKTSARQRTVMYSISNGHSYYFTSLLKSHILLSFTTVLNLSRNVCMLLNIRALLTL